MCFCKNSMLRVYYKMVVGNIKSIIYTFIFFNVFKNVHKINEKGIQNMGKS